MLEKRLFVIVYSYLTTIYVNSNVFQHLIVMGGSEGPDNRFLDTAEVYSFRDNAWTEAGKLPARMKVMRAATINNRVLLFGKYNLFWGFFRFRSRGTAGSGLGLDNIYFLQVDGMIPSLPGTIFLNMSLRQRSGHRSAQ